MISFRYHLITIVAVFLALGLGLLAGTTVLDQGLVNNLRGQTDRLRAELQAQRAEVGRLQDQTGQLERAGDILPVVDRGLLAGVPVVIVVQQGTDDTVLAQARRSLDEARADLLAVLTVTDRMALADDTARQDLARILQASPDTSAQTLQATAADRLAQRLAVGPGRREAQPTEHDLLSQLLTENFLSAPGITGGDLPRIGGRDQVIVVLAGGDAEPVVSPDGFLVPLVEDLVGRGARVAAGESASSVYPFVEALRSDGSVADGTRMVTVDDVDFSLGGAALVLGVERMLFSGQGGNYGVKGSPTDVQPIPPLA